MAVKVEGLPAKRPRCQHCDRPLKYFTEHTRSPPPDSKIVRRVFQFWRGYSRVDDVPRWCTLRCALAFANAAYKGGYRMPRKG